MHTKQLAFSLFLQLGKAEGLVENFNDMEVPIVILVTLLLIK